MTFSWFACPKLSRGIWGFVLFLLCFSCFLVFFIVICSALLILNFLQWIIVPQNVSPRPWVPSLGGLAAKGRCQNSKLPKKCFISADRQASQHISNKSVGVGSVWTRQASDSNAAAGALGAGYEKDHLEIPILGKLGMVVLTSKVDGADSNKQTKKDW